MISESKIQTIGCSIKARPLSTEGLSSINLVVIIDRKSDRIPLQIQWPTVKFDQSFGKLLPRFPNDKECIDNNLIIEKFLAQANNLRLQYYAYGKHVSLKEFKLSLINFTSRKNIIDYIETKIDFLYKKGVISEKTKRLNKTSLQTLLNFKGRELWTFDNITTSDLKAFQNWLLKFGKVMMINNRQQSTGYTFNTVAGHIKFLRKYLLLAKEDKVPFQDPFIDFSIPQYVPGHREVPDRNEVRKLYGLRGSERLTDHEKEVLDRYLIGCFTGLRKSDIEALVPKKHSNGGRLLLNPQKTMGFGTHVEFKLPKPALEILTDYPEGFGSMADLLLNKTIKKVMGLAEITKYIKFHSSRDYFAVQYLKFGGNLGDLKDILGHKKITTTEIYLKMGSDAKNDTMQMFDQI